MHRIPVVLSYALCHAGTLVVIAVRRCQPQVSPWTAGDNDLFTALAACARLVSGGVRSLGSIGIDGAGGVRADGPCVDDINRYVDCANGTVTDTVTGLIWLKQADCLANTSWAAANQVAGGLQHGDCGLTDRSSPGDWPLPTKDEWAATIARAVALDCVLGLLSGPALTNDAGVACYNVGGSSFTGVAADFYWSSTTNEEFPFKAWLANLIDGYIATSNFHAKNDGSLRVWPRGGTRSVAAEGRAAGERASQRRGSQPLQLLRGRLRRRLQPPPHVAHPQLVLDRGPKLGRRLIAHRAAQAAPSPCRESRASGARRRASPRRGELRGSCVGLSGCLRSASTTAMPIGGVVARSYAAEFAGVAGIVLVDALHEDSTQFNTTVNRWVRVRESSTGKTVPEPAIGTASPTNPPDDFLADELQKLHDARSRRSATLGDIPLFVIAAGRREQPPGTSDSFGLR